MLRVLYWVILIVNCHIYKYTHMYTYMYICIIYIHIYIYIYIYTRAHVSYIVQKYNVFTRQCALTAFAHQDFSSLQLPQLNSLCAHVCTHHCRAAREENSDFMAAAQHCLLFTRKERRGNQLSCVALNNIDTAIQNNIKR